MTTQELLDIRRNLIIATDEASHALVMACRPYRGDMGLVSDEFRATELYKSLSAYYNQTKEALRQWNHAMRHNKEYQKAVRDEIMQRRLAK